MPSNRPTLIVLDEDPAALKEIEDIAAAQFTVSKPRRPEQAMTLLQTCGPLAVIVVDQNLTGGGLAVLKSAQKIRPDVRRVLIAGPGNLAETIEGLHSGAVERIIYKPIRAAEVLAAVAATPANGAALRATA